MKTSKNSQMINIATLTIAASLIYGLSSGLRANYGVLLGPISENSGIAYASVSFVIAIAQLSFGIMQPLFGIVGMKRSNKFVLRFGAILLTIGLILLPFCKTFFALIIVLGICIPSGTAALSFGIVMSILTQKLPQKASSTASGIVTASSGVGSSILSPVLQTLTAAIGLLGAMLFMSVLSLLMLPVSVYLCNPARTAQDLSENIQENPNENPKENLSEESDSPGLLPLVKEAIHSRDYLFLLAGFFTCGFHMAIIETHLYTQITTYGFSDQTAAFAFSVYGIATLIGSVLSGILCGKFAMKNVLSALYASRVIMVLAFLALPKTIVSVYCFVILLGLTGCATVPPTSGITERLFGPVKLATLFGVVFFSHQIGSFLSAWLGGICLSATGGYNLIWIVAAILSAFAAAVSFKISKV